MYVGKPHRTVRYEENVKRKLRPYLERYEKLGEFILAIEYVLKRNPEDEETVPINEEYPNNRSITRLPQEELDIPLPKIQLLYEYSENEVVIWAARIEDPSS